MTKYLPQGSSSTSNSPQIYSGTDANKSSSPTVGMRYFTTDTAKTYYCYVAGYWTLIDSPSYEIYENHNGTVDNFMQSAATGNSTSLTDITTHSMKLDTGINALGYANYITKSSWALSANPIIVEFIIQNPSVTQGGYIDIGFRADFTITGADNCAVFEFEDFNGGTGWKTLTANGAEEYYAINSLVSGDKLGIIITNSLVLYFVNGLLKHSTTNNIPPLPVYIGSSVVYTHIPDAKKTVDIDYIKIKRMI